MEVLSLGTYRSNGPKSFHGYKAQKTVLLSQRRAAALIAMLTNSRTYDRNTNTCDCFASYGVIVTWGGGQVEFLADAGRLVEVSEGTAWAQSWRQGAFQELSHFAH